MLQIDNNRYLYNVRTCVCVYLHRHHAQLSSSCTDNDKEQTYDFIYKGLPMCLLVLCIVPGLGHSTLWLVLYVVPDIHASLYRLSCNSHNPAHPTLFQIYRSAPDSVQLFLVVVIDKFTRVYVHCIGMPVASF